MINFEHNLLVLLSFPDAITSHDYEVDVIREVKLVGVRVCRDRLLFGLQTLFLLVLKVT